MELDEGQKFSISEQSNSEADENFKHNVQGQALKRVTLEKPPTKYIQPQKNRASSFSQPYHSTTQNVQSHVARKSERLKEPQLSKG